MPDGRGILGIFAVSFLGAEAAPRGLVPVTRELLTEVGPVLSSDLRHMLSHFHVLEPGGLSLSPAGCGLIGYVLFFLGVRLTMAGDSDPILRAAERLAAHVDEASGSALPLGPSGNKHPVFLKSFEKIPLSSWSP